MYIVTPLDYGELGTLIRNKRLSLDNSEIFFGPYSEFIGRYLKELVGYNGFVLGLRARLNPNTAKIVASIDPSVTHTGRAILEAQIDESDVVRFRVRDLTTAAEALQYGLSDDEVIQQLEKAQVLDTEPEGVEVLCVPYVKIDGHVRVTSLAEDIEFDVEGITFVKVVSNERA